MKRLAHISLFAILFSLTLAAALIAAPAPANNIVDQIPPLVDRLSDENYIVREKAVQDLIALGVSIRPALQRLKTEGRLTPDQAGRFNLDTEQAARINQVLEALDAASLRANMKGSTVPAMDISVELVANTSTYRLSPEMSGQAVRDAIQNAGNPGGRRGGGGGGGTGRGQRRGVRGDGQNTPPPPGNAGSIPAQEAIDLPLNPALNPAQVQPLDPDTPVAGPAVGGPAIDPAPITPPARGGRAGRGGPAAGVPPPPAVELALNLTNLSGKAITLEVGGDASFFTMKLTGPGAVSYEPQNIAMTMEFRMGQPVTLAPGKTVSIPIKSLNYGSRELFAAYWTEPGDYSLEVSLGANAATGPGEGVRITFKAPPLKLKVIASDAPMPATMRGQIDLATPGMALPPNAIAVVSLQDTSLADAPAKIIVQTTVDARTFPIPFELSYDPAQTPAGNRNFTLGVRILAGDKLIFINDTQTNVINRGPSNNVTVRVAPVK